jgi:O-antigen/teichoic acid export membrane protein
MFRNILKGTAIGVINKSIAAIATFFIFPLMLKQMGSVTFGIWMTISSSVGMMTFLDFGIGNTLMNFIAWNKNDKPQISKYIKLAYTIQTVVIGTFLLLFAVFFKFINWGSIFNITNLSADILAGIFITIACFLISLTTNSIYAIQKGLQKSLTANLWQLVSTVISVAALYFTLLYHPTIKWIALVNLGIPIAFSALNTLVYFYKEQLFNLKDIAISKAEALGFLGNSGLLLFLQVAAIICFETDCLILAHYSNFNEVTRFAVVAKIYTIPVIILGVYLQILWPAYASAFADNKWLWIKKTFYRSLGTSIVLSVGFIILAIMGKNLLLKYWIANQVQIPASLFIAFSFWTIVNNIDANIATILNGLNKIKVQAFLALLMLITNVFLSIFFVKQWGVTGVIWGSIVASTCFSVVPFLFYIHKILKQHLGESA